MEDIKVLVKPNAKKNEFLGFDDSRGYYRVAIKARAEKGEANRELVRFLGKHFGKKVTLVSGATSRTKKMRLS